MNLLDADHLWIHRQSGFLHPLARYEIRDAANVVMGRAMEEQISAWLLPLKITRMRPVTPLILRVEEASGLPVFSLTRDWDWLERKPIEVQNAGGITLLRLRRKGVLLGWPIVVEDPYLGPIGVVHALQIITIRDLRYEVRDQNGQPIASICWFLEGLWQPRRRCEVRVAPGPWRIRWPYLPLAAALMVGLSVEGR